MAKPTQVETFTVIVGNVGTVYTGAERYARKEFNEWTRLAKATQGRAAGEDVTLVDYNGDIANEYIGRISRKAEF